MLKAKFGNKTLCIALAASLMISSVLTLGAFAGDTRGQNLLTATVDANTAIAQNANDQMEDFKLWHVEGSSTQDPKPVVSDMFDRWFYNKTVSNNIFGDDSNKTPTGNVSLHFGARNGGTSFDQVNKRPSLWVAAQGLEAGKKYVVEAWVKTGALHDENHGVRIAYGTFDKDVLGQKTAQEDSNDPWVFTDGTNPTCDGENFDGCTMLKDDNGNILVRPINTWTKMSATFTAGSDTDAVMLRVYTTKINTAAEGWIGDVGVYEVTTDTSSSESSGETSSSVEPSPAPSGNLFQAPFTEGFTVPTAADAQMADYEAWPAKGIEGQTEAEWPKVSDAFSKWIYAGYLYEDNLYRDAQMTTPSGDASMHLGSVNGSQDLDEEPKRASVFTAGRIEAGKKYQISMYVKTTGTVADHGLRVAYGTFSTAENNNKAIALRDGDDAKVYTGGTEADIENINAAFGQNITNATAADFAKLSLLKDADGNTLISTADKNAEWKKITAVFTAAEDADAVMLRIYTNKINMVASAWVGDITLKEYDGTDEGDNSQSGSSSDTSSEDDGYDFPSAGENLINGDMGNMNLFNLGDGLSYKTFWEDGGRWGVYPYFDYVATDNTVLSPTGKPSAKITIDEEEGTGVGFNRMVTVTPIEPFKTYTVSFKAKWKDVEKAYFEYRVYYGINMQITTDIVPTVATVAIKDIDGNESFTGTSEDWVTFEFDLEAEDEYFEYLQLKFEGHGDADSALWISDVSVVEKTEGSTDVNSNASNVSKDDTSSKNESDAADTGVSLPVAFFMLIVISTGCMTVMVLRRHKAR